MVELIWSIIKRHNSTHNYPVPLFPEHMTISTQNLFTVEAIIKKLFLEPRKSKIQSAVARRFTVKVAKCKIHSF